MYDFAVLGFEMGYSPENYNSLVMREAQFGDFAHGAEVLCPHCVLTVGNVP